MDTYSYRKQIGQRIQENRRRQKVSQEEIAEELGVSRQTIGAWETGRKSIKAEQLCAIADFLAINISNFFPPINETIYAFGYDKKQPELLDALAFSSPENTGSTKSVDAEPIIALSQDDINDTKKVLSKGMQDVLENNPKRINLFLRFLEVVKSDLRNQILLMAICFLPYISHNKDEIADAEEIIKDMMD